MEVVELETGRIRLRQWRQKDLPAFYALNSDPDVMKYFPATLSREESDAMANKCRALIADQGWGFWAAELKANSEFMGFVGLHTPKASLPIAPCVEIGWRLARNYWGYGFASEAATSALSFAFNTRALTEVVAFTTVQNVRSRAVMERLGMKNTLQNFQHPDVPTDCLLAEHVLYKIRRDEWQGQVTYQQGCHT